MKIAFSSTIQSLVLAAALGMGLCFVPPVSAQRHAYIADSNGKGVTALGTLGGSDSSASGINDAGGYRGGPPRPQVMSTPLSPAPMAWA